MALKNDAKRVFADALEELLESRELKEITVLDIAEKCNSSRSTFYHYFKDKYDLANWIYEDFLAGYLSTQSSSAKSWMDMQMEPLEFIYSKRKYFSKICQYKGQNSFCDFVFEVTRKRSAEFFHLLCHAKTLSEEQLFSIDYMAAGLAKSIIGWIENGFKMKPEKMAQYLIANTPPIFFTLHKEPADGE